MESITESTAHVESRHAADHNWTNQHETSKASTANVPSNGASGAANIGGAGGGCIVSELRNLLGRDVVLLPIEAGTKKPIGEKWQNTAIESMHDAEYLARLARGNIGVLLGKASGSLCTIDIDADEYVEPFLALNPKLRTTLRSKGARGVQLWIRMDGEFPKLTKIKTAEGEDWGEWRCDGGQSVIHGVHPDGMNYRRIVEAHPITVAFDEIVWPQNLKLPWVKTEYELLVEKYGRPYSLTTKGVLSINDMFFTAKFSKKHLVLWETSEQEFYGYNIARGLWEKITEEKLKWDFGMDMKEVADETSIDQFLWKIKDGTLQSLVNSLKGAMEKTEVFVKHAPVIHLANGMLNLGVNPPQLKGFHPDYYSRNICPIALNPNAQCPRFLNELLGVALDRDDVRLLQIWAGSVLVGGNAGQRILLIQGTPNGGKSTVIEIIEKIIGTNNVAQMRTQHLNERFELQKFLGKTLLTGKDVSADFLSQDGAEVLKALVGNDLLDAEKKGVNQQFQLRGNFAMAITCNSKLRVRLEGDVGAWQRRLMVINYTRPKPEKRIANFADVLIAEEGPGILNWMIEGAVIYLQQLKDGGTIRLTRAQQQRVDLLLAESDSVRQFVQDWVVAEDRKDVSVLELQGAYFEYCDEMGWRAFSPGDFKSSIGDVMLDIHHVSKRNDISRGLEKTVRGFRNVAIVGRA